MVTRRFAFKTTSTIKRSDTLLPVAFLVLLTVLVGCSSSHTLQFDATQPVYFGNAPQSVLPIDTAHVNVVGEVVLSTTHQFEKEPTPAAASLTSDAGVTEKVVGDIPTQLEDSLGHDQDKFIGNAVFQVDIEANITWTFDFIGLFFSGSAPDVSSDNTGRSSTETIGIAGTIYKNRRAGR